MSKKLMKRLTVLNDIYWVRIVENVCEGKKIMTEPNVSQIWLFTSSIARFPRVEKRKKTARC